MVVGCLVDDGGGDNGVQAPTTAEFSVNMTCGGCKVKVTNALKERGIHDFKVDLSSQTVRITSTKQIDELKSALEDTGKIAVLVGMGGQAQTASTPGAAAVAMLGVDGDFYTPGTQGVIRFSQINKTSCVVEGTIDGLSPGDHGLALHETGDVSRGCASLGDHYNPRNTRHGSPENVESERHVGDLGNIRADESGRATFRIVDPLIKVWDIIGRSVVVSSNKDDLGLGGLARSKIDGNCGAGVACGIIARSAGIGENVKKICQCDGVTLWDERNKPLTGPSRRE